MSYLVLARKFRPQTFSSVAGQEHITRALANAIVRNRVPHALLFSGPRGVGKTTLARIFAKALNCTGRSLKDDGLETDEIKARDLIEPCGNCSNCTEIARSASLAVWEIDGASNNSVEDVRELIDSLHSLPPPSSKYKVYIIDEVHMLSTAAFNALLKSLEEPPPNTIFVFATTEPHKIPETVISRCQRHDFRRLPFTTIVEQLSIIANKEEMKIENGVLELIAKKAEGGMRDAQSMLDRLFAFSADTITLSVACEVLGVLDRSFFSNLASAIIEQQPKECLRLLNDAFRQSVDLRSFIADFLAYWRNLLLSSVFYEQSSQEESSEVLRLFELTSEEIKDLDIQAQKTNRFDLERLFALAEKTADSALESNFPRFVLEAGLVKMASISSLRPLTEIISSLEGQSKDINRNANGEKSYSPSIHAADRLQKNIIEPEQIARGAEFNPSWQDFVNHVKDRSEVVLSAFLRRVFPMRFELGKLEIEATSFDFVALKESANIQSLKACLHSYSGEQNWSVDIKEINDKKQNNQQTVTTRSGALPGSLAKLEAEAERERTLELDREARNHPLVQSALNTFEGSKVEKVSVLKR